MSVVNLKKIFSASNFGLFNLFQFIQYSSQKSFL